MKQKAKFRFGLLLAVLAAAMLSACSSDEEEFLDFSHLDVEFHLTDEAGERKTTFSENERFWGVITFTNNTSQTVLLSDREWFGDYVNFDVYSVDGTHCGPSIIPSTLKWEPYYLRPSESVSFESSHNEASFRSLVEGEYYAVPKMCVKVGGDWIVMSDASCRFNVVSGNGAEGK